MLISTENAAYFSSVSSWQVGMATDVSEPNLKVQTNKVCRVEHQLDLESVMYKIKISYEIARIKLDWKKYPSYASNVQYF